MVASMAACATSVLGNAEPYRRLVYRMDIARLVERIKLSPRHLLPLPLMNGFVLFALQRWLSAFGLPHIAGSERD
jgi:hypothetical protein